MGFGYRKRRRVGKRTHVNLSKSGLSTSYKVGPVTLNSRGRIFANLGKGFYYRKGR